MDPQLTPQPCKLHLDVLELIIHVHRNDQATLSAIALASQSLLQISRKLLYRSVSLDYCENPYGHEQQRRLRSSLATYPHLCSYIRSLRLSLPVNSALDPDVDNTLNALSRVENLHLIGNGVGVDYDIVDDNISFVAPMFGPVQLGDIDLMENSRARSRGELEGALKKVFGLKSLKKVTLENIYPLDEVYVSCFADLKHLELLSVGTGPIGLTPFPTSQSNATSLDNASSVSASSSGSTSSTSLASHPPPSSPSPSSPPPPSNPSSPPLSPSDSASSWRLLLSNPDGMGSQDRERYGQHEDRQGPTNLITGTLSLMPVEGSSSDVNSNGISSGSSLGSQLAGVSGRYHPAPHADGEVLTEDEIGRLKGSKKETRSSRRTREGPRKVFLEYLVLNLEHLRPVLGVMCRPTSQVREVGGDHASPSRQCDVGSVLDFSRLKQAHVYVWDSDDGHAIWSILEAARKTIERLTLRYFHYGEDFFVYHQGFENLQSLVLGTRTFSVKDDPFRPLIHFFSDPSKFPSLRKIKISFDLWGCESSGTSWKEVGGYRGWRELDDAFAALDYVQTSSSPSLPVEHSPAARSPRLASIVFELWCSASYKVSPGGRLSGGSPPLVLLIREELSYLKHNKHFILL